MNETLKLGKNLFIICAVAGAVLAVANYFTSEKIARQKFGQEKSSLKEVLPAASSFEYKNDYTEGFDGKNNSVGYVLNVSTSGYSSEISALVAVDKEFKITGIKILSQNETPGLGAKISENGFLRQFLGKFPEKIMLRKNGGEIDGVTSATISSRAITDAVREKINEFKKTVKPR